MANAALWNGACKDSPGYEAMGRGECCDDGLVVRLGGEQGGMRWPVCIIALVLLGWSFQGVAIIADVFMGAIEKITSRRVRKWNSKLQRYVTVTVWNSTVANLTLMALGSSAPEIMLNVIGIIKDNFTVESALGPATIVGSAAFNLLMIIAVCIIAIPADDTRRIKEYPVFVCTAIWSIFAYVWLLVILQWVSPGVIEVWEGVLTFIFFPMLTGMSYAFDRGCFMDDGADDPEPVLYPEATAEELADMEMKIRQEHGKDLTDEQVVAFMHAECGPPESRAKYRIAATRALFGGKQVGATSPANHGKDAKVVPLADDMDGAPKGKPDEVKLQFATEKYAVLESAGVVELKLLRLRNSEETAKCKVTVSFKTRDGLAKAGEDYDYLEDKVVFEPGCDEQTIKIKIINDNAYEEDEEFYVDIFDATVEGGTCNVVLGEACKVTIIDDDLPGMLRFDEELIKLEEKLEDQELDIKVCRKDGCSNEITCKWRTEANTALEDRDFEKADGELKFEHGEIEKVITVTIKGKGRYEVTHDFRVVLEEVEGGKFDATTDGGAESCICTIQIEGKNNPNLVNLLKTKMDKAKVGHSSWRDQFKECFQIKPKPEDDEEEPDDSPPGVADYIFWAIAFPWKVLFAFCPPTDYCGGWVCFNGSLMFIGAVTVLIGDFAELLGCTLGIEDLVTAITFVALGTSLPDTFASKQAALQDETADASIVNVTGSNSVNVYLGIGLPWMVGAAHWRITKGQPMPVAVGDMLGFSISIFAGCAFGCLSLLAFRRKYAGGELGGKYRWPSAIFLVTLWLSYVVVSALKSSGKI